MDIHCAAAVFKLNPSVSWPLAFPWCCASRGDAHNVVGGDCQEMVCLLLQHVLDPLLSS